MDVRPCGADQRDLDCEQNQPADEGNGMKMDDQGVVQPELFYVVKAIGAKAR
jgi:hypothetical protein